MPKRKANEFEQLEEAVQSVDIKDNKWMEKLLEIDEDHLALILAEIANRGNITNKVFKAARIALPSFSIDKWAAFAKEADLPSNPTQAQLMLGHFSTPIYQLPPSFHEAILQASWHTQDVYREKVAQTARLRMLDTYIVPILALFRGRLNDTPEKYMPGYAYLSGGEIEHEIVMIGRNTAFLIIELKIFEASGSSLAQLFLEFLFAAKLNRQVHFEGLRIYGLLTDMSYFSFYSYDPSTNTFFRDYYFAVDNKRMNFLSDMILVTNKIFGLILFAYIEGLHAMIERSKARDVQGDDSTGFAPLDFLLCQCGNEAFTSSGYKNKTEENFPGAQKSTDMWECALALALQSCEKFDEDTTSLADMESKSTEALEFLSQSALSIPHLSNFTGEKEVRTSAELEDVAHHIVEATLKKQLSL